MKGTKQFPIAPRRPNPYLAGVFRRRQPNVLWAGRGSGRASASLVLLLRSSRSNPQHLENTREEKEAPLALPMAHGCGS